MGHGLDAGQRPARWRSLGPREGRPGPRPGRGAAGAGDLVRRAARLGQKPATWRALGPPRPAPRKAGSCASRAQASAAAGPRGQPAGSRTRWAGARLRPPGAALLSPRPRCSRQANPIRPLHRRGNRPLGLCSHWDGPGVPAAFRRRFLPQRTWAGSVASAAAAPTDGARTLPGRGRR